VNVPNLLTSARLVAVPVFVGFFLRGERKAALGVFIGAMITDALDGILARALKQFTRIGAFLDPVADRLLGLAALVLLCWSRALPWWLLGVALFRDVCIVTAIWLLERTGRSYTVRPTRFGKYATAALAATTVLALVQGATEVAAPTRPLVVALALISAECVLISWAQYLWLFIRLMRLPPERKHADARA
jgi:cardiolipin synthase (CMP-forming)